MFHSWFMTPIPCWLCSLIYWFYRVLISTKLHIFILSEGPIMKKLYGVCVERRDRFYGTPTWLSSCIRQYERGVLGPHHACSHCLCAICCRLRWLREPNCRCVLKIRKGQTLEVAIRQKWWNCRCYPMVKYTPTWACPCLKELGHKQWLAKNDYDSDESDVDFVPEFVKDAMRSQAKAQFPNLE